MIYSFTYPATKEHFPEMLASIVKVGKDSGLEEKSLFKLKLIAEEILINVIKYAYPDGEGSLTIDSETEPQEKIIITVTNSGIPFNPLEKEPPDTTSGVEERPVGGLGIFLTRKMSDAVKYHYKDGKNILSFVLHIAHD